MMRKRPSRRRGGCCKIGVVLALAAFLGALMCLSFFSVKFLIFAVAVLLIVLGIFLLKI